MLSKTLRSRFLWGILIFLSILFGLGAYAFASFLSYDRAVLQESIMLTVEEGDSFQDLENKIQRYISSSFGMHWFSLRARSRNIDQRIAVGIYDLKKGIGLPDVLHILSNRDVMQFPLTIVEGISLETALLQIDGLSYLRGRLQYTPKAILPETYMLAGLEHKDQVVKRLEKELEKVLALAWQNRQKDLPLKSPDALLVLASLIEKEASDDAERNIIAGVFINRLRKNMLLQTDPSVFYARNRIQGVSTRPLRKSDLKIDSPYNTYLYKGLPPGPIALAGKKSIEAASQPAKTDFLYFVADGKGKHRFAKTLKEHHQNVALYRKTQKENE